MNENKKFPHLIHGVMTLLTAGSWIIIWIIHYFIRRTKSTHIDAEKIKLKIQFFVYMAFGLILLLLTLNQFGTFREPGMTFTSIVLSGVVCFLWVIISFISIFWSITAIPFIREKYPKMVQRTPKFFNNYLLPVMMFALILISWKIDQYSIEQQGENLHFTNGFKEAKRNNIFSVEEWNAFKIQKAKELESSIAEKQRSKQLEDQKCNANAYCYASHHKSSTYECQKAVESSAKYDFKWTDGTLEQKFSSYGWYDQSNKLVTMQGHRAQAQNGFGAYKNIEYSCTFNADTGEIVSVDMH